MIKFSQVRLQRLRRPGPKRVVDHYLSSVRDSNAEESFTLLSKRDKDHMSFSKWKQVLDEDQGSTRRILWFDVTDDRRVAPKTAEVDVLVQLDLTDDRRVAPKTAEVDVLVQPERSAIQLITMHVLSERNRWTVYHGFDHTPNVWRREAGYGKANPILDAWYRIPLLGVLHPAVAAVYAAAIIIYPLGVTLIPPRSIWGVFSFKAVLLATLIVLGVHIGRDVWKELVTSFERFWDLLKRRPYVAAVFSIPVGVFTVSRALGVYEPLPSDVLPVQAVTLMLLGPFLNELYFRGYMQKELDDDADVVETPAVSNLWKFLLSRGLVISTISFCFVNLPEIIVLVDFNVVPGFFQGLIGLLGFGLIFGIVYRLTRSVIFPMVLHFIMNASFLSSAL